jgi:hypothetical protein
MIAAAGQETGVVSRQAANHPLDLVDLQVQRGARVVDANHA